MMLWMNANDGGPIEDAIYRNNLTVATYYATVTFSLVKCIAALVIHN